MHKPLRCESAQDFYVTTDLNCSVSLICSGFELASLDRTDPRRVRFVFYKFPGLEQAVDDYWSNTLLVKARTMADNLKSMKSRLYGG